MRKEKGQDIIEYALMLAMVVGIGFGIYSYGGSGIGNSISTVFNNAGNLLEKVGKEKLPVASSADDIIKRLRDARDQGLADILTGNPDSPIDIDSDSETGRQLAQALNIQTKEGDGWFARVNPGHSFIISYYSAADNKGVTFDQLKSDYASHPEKYPEDSTGHYNLYIDEGYFYDNNGKRQIYHKVPGHIEPSPDGSGGMSIYPGPKKAK
jgi:Flp pilus assembly pilin Flp